jgi:hypothetical protein
LPEGGYEDVLRKLGHDPKHSQLKDSLKALEEGKQLATPGRLTGSLRRTAPKSTFVVLLWGLASFVLGALWVTHRIGPVPSHLMSTRLEQIKMYLFFGMPSLATGILVLLYALIVFRVFRRFRNGEQSVIPPSSHAIQ